MIQHPFRRYIFFCFFSVFVLLQTGCDDRKYLASRNLPEIFLRWTVFGLIRKQLYSVLEHFVGKENLDALIENLIGVITNRMFNNMASSAYAEKLSFKCNPGELELDCKNRAISFAEYNFNIYAHEFVTTFNNCRDQVVFSKETASLDYTRQVDAIGKCMSDSGYAEEIAAINSYIKGNIF